MSVTEEARRVVGQHLHVGRKSYGALVSCTCHQWRGHRDMHPAHVVEALDAAGLLAADLPQPGATLAAQIRALGNVIVSPHIDLGPLVREAERLEARLAQAARLKCQVTRTVNKPVHVHITWDNVPIAVGYIEGPGTPTESIVSRLPEGEVSP